MTRSVIMNLESGFLEQQKFDASAQQKEPNHNSMPGVSRSMPDLYSCADNIESQIATLNITSEEIIVNQKLSPHQHSVDNFGDYLVNSSSLNCLRKSYENQAASVQLSTKEKNDTSEGLTTLSDKLSTSANLEQLSARADVDEDNFLGDENTTADSVSLSEDRLEFTEVSLNNSEDDAVESPRESTDINADVKGSYSQQRKNGVMDSFFDWLSPTSPTVKSSSTEANDSATMCSSPTSPTISKTTLFKQKNFFFWNKPIEPLSTTALILEDRPRNLPKKPLSESEKHRMEYEKMVERARKNEIKEGQLRRKKIKEQLKQEESIASIGAIWQHEILPQWASMRHTLRVRQLWWNGLPPNVRGKVWQLAIGNDLNLTTDLYEIMVSRAHEKLRSMNKEQTSTFEDSDSSLTVDREDTVELIRLDISRTFPKLCIFQKGGPYHDVLHDILGAYVCYRPDVGYVQGMSFIAAMLLLNMEPCHVFLTFANTLNRPCQIAFFRLNEEMMKAYFAAFEVFFEENLPRLFAHFKQSNLTPDMYLIDWIFTMFSKSLNLDTASRVWDVFCRDGEEFLFKTAIGILKLHRDTLLGMEFIHCAQFLTKLPPMDGSQGERLFRHIADLTMVSRNNRRWKDVLSLLLQQRRDDPTTSA